MTSLDSQSLFSSGPCEITPGPWERQTVRRGFVGLDGELVFDLGKRSRTVVQTGRLSAGSASALQSLIDAIQAKADGQLHSLTDNHNQTYSNVLLESFQLETPLRRGRAFYCDYRITYRQLP
ncbi:MAG: hypothetical protein K8S55_03200 [Phycisphaerae bacterium]|nr:hypothetical protein [Phycisphaerae bacterium]